MRIKFDAGLYRIQPTYEELKRVLFGQGADVAHRIQPTYEELKPEICGVVRLASRVSSLPMRN